MEKNVIGIQTENMERHQVTKPYIAQEINCL